MPESEEELAPTKILVRACNGDLWLVRKGANPRKVHSNAPDALPEDKDPELVGILNENDQRVADHFPESANPGVRVAISVVDFD
jgi:hypothetical protein